MDPSIEWVGEGKKRLEINPRSELAGLEGGSKKQKVSAVRHSLKGFFLAYVLMDDNREKCTTFELGMEAERRVDFAIKVKLTYLMRNYSSKKGRCSMRMDLTNGGGLVI